MNDPAKLAAHQLRPILMNRQMRRQMLGRADLNDDQRLVVDELAEKRAAFEAEKRRLQMLAFDSLPMRIQAAGRLGGVNFDAIKIAFGLETGQFTEADVLAQIGMRSGRAI